MFITYRTFILLIILTIVLIGLIIFLTFVGTNPKKKKIYPPANSASTHEVPVTRNEPFTYENRSTQEQEKQDFSSMQYQFESDSFQESQKIEEDELIILPYPQNDEELHRLYNRNH